MRALDPFSILFTRRMRRFVDQMTAVRAGERDGVHQARIASRRVREVLPILRSKASADSVRKLRRGMRRATGVLGPVRESDVTLALADERMEKADASTRPLLGRVRAALERERARRLDDLVDVLTITRVDRLERLSARLVDALAEDPDVDGGRARLAKRLSRRARQLTEAMDEAGVIFLADRLHDVRIAVKKLRYALELAGDTRLARTAVQVKRLKAAQDDLGHLHDLQVMGDYIRRHADAKSPAAIRRLDALEASIDEENRRLHGEYLASQPQLLALASDVISRLVPQVAAPPAPAPRSATRPASARAASPRSANLAQHARRGKPPELAGARGRR